MSYDMILKVQHSEHSFFIKKNIGGAVTKALDTTISTSALAISQFPSFGYIVYFPLQFLAWGFL